jgi:hypothetical protein
MWLWLGLPVLLFLALAIPVEVAFAAASGEGARLRLVWLFGLLSVSPSPARRRPRREPPRQPANGSGPRRLLAALRSPGFLMGVARLCRRLLSAFSLRVQASAELGLDDPADTGELYGLLSAAIAPLQREALQLEVTPNFLEPGLSGQVDAFARFSPLRLLAEALAFGLSRATLRALWVAART